MPLMSVWLTTLREIELASMSLTMIWSDVVPGRAATFLFTPLMSMVADLSCTLPVAAPGIGALKAIADASVC